MATSHSHGVGCVYGGPVRLGLLGREWRGVGVNGPTSLLLPAVHAANLVDTLE